MKTEIERKFLVTGDGWRALSESRYRIRQAYLADEGNASIRVRIRDEVQATLTIKSRNTGAERQEFEYPLPLDHAQALLALRCGAIVEKVRARVPFAGLVWEVDTFDGDNLGLVIAEVELERRDQEVHLPAWVGREVTSEMAYYNSALSVRPYRLWPMQAGENSGSDGPAG